MITHVSYTRAGLYEVTVSAPQVGMESKILVVLFGGTFPEDVETKWIEEGRVLLVTFEQTTSNYLSISYERLVEICQTHYNNPRTPIRNFVRSYEWIAPSWEPRVSRIETTHNSATIHFDKNVFEFARTMAPEDLDGFQDFIEVISKRIVDNMFGYKPDRLQAIWPAHHLLVLQWRPS